MQALLGAARLRSIHQAPPRIRSSIKAIEQSLDPQNFGRIHRSTIVNFTRVKKFRKLARGDYILTLSNGTELKTSRPYRERVPAPNLRAASEYCHSSLNVLISRRLT